jgi:hypothetical protein
MDSRIDLFGDAIKTLPTVRTAVKRLPPATLIFRLYELLRNDSRFFQIADASGLFLAAGVSNR